MKPPGGAPIGEVGEDAAVARFRELASSALGEAVLIGPGDDTAAFRMEEGRIVLFTCDMMTEGIHFRREWSGAEEIGWKAMAQNISDIAAMGGEPRFAVASVAMPGEAEAEFAEDLARGLISAASSYGAALVGGDLVGSTGPIVVDVALMGVVEEELLLRRRGARPGDAILVTGSLGASAAGLALLSRGAAGRRSPEVKRVLQAHRTPRPRVAEARAIAGSRRATAMMDVSDGIAQDLARLCRESGVGARVRTDRIPVDAACAAVAKELGEDALEWAAGGGEDYELLVTCPAAAAEEIAAAVSEKTDTPVAVIGEITREEGVSFLGADGEARMVGPGFDHFGRRGAAGGENR